MGIIGMYSRKLCEQNTYDVDEKQEIYLKQKRSGTFFEAYINCITQLLSL